MRNLLKILKSHFGNTIFGIVGLSIITGVSNMFLLHTLSEILAGKIKDPMPLVFYGGVLVVLFFSNRMLGRMVIKITQKTVFDLREKMIHDIDHSPYTHFLKVGKDKILNTLVGDTQSLANIGIVTVFVLNAVSVLLFCFIYLAYLSVTVFATLISVAALSIFLYVSVMKHVWRNFKKARDIEDNYVRLVGDFLSAFRELKINNAKKTEFIQSDLLDSNKAIRDIRTDTGVNHTTSNVIVMTGLYFVLGIMAYLMLFVFHSASIDIITYGVVVIYMIGPIKSLLGNYQAIAHMEVAAGRVLELSAALEGKDSNQNQKQLESKVQMHFENLTLQGVSFTHQSLSPFKVGPIQLSINRGETLFIAGGNGSGKTTLINLILGLHPPDEGSIMFNGVHDAVQLASVYRNFFSVLYADFHLLKKIYGVGAVGKEEFDKIIRYLKLEGKVSMSENSFNSTSLSQGQKKRLALLVALFEDKDVLILDEFAADQDPEFRDYFYNQILPDLKQRGKTIIAITHDDKYFNRCDKFIKMDAGKIDRIETKNKIAQPVLE